VVSQANLAVNRVLVFPLQMKESSTVLQVVENIHSNILASFKSNLDNIGKEDAVIEADPVSTKDCLVDHATTASFSSAAAGEQNNRESLSTQQILDNGQMIPIDQVKKDSGEDEMEITASKMDTILKEYIPIKSNDEEKIAANDRVLDMDQHVQESQFLLIDSKSGHGEHSSEVAIAYNENVDMESSNSTIFKADTDDYKMKQQLSAPILDEVAKETLFSGTNQCNMGQTNSHDICSEYPDDSEFQLASASVQDTNNSLKSHESSSAEPTVSNKKRKSNSSRFWVYVDESEQEDASQENIDIGTRRKAAQKASNTLANLEKPKTPKVKKEPQVDSDGFLIDNLSSSDEEMERKTKSNRRRRSTSTVGRHRKKRNNSITEEDGNNEKRRQSTPSVHSDTGELKRSGFFRAKNWRYTNEPPKNVFEEIGIPEIEVDGKLTRSKLKSIPIVETQDIDVESEQSDVDEPTAEIIGEDERIMLLKSLPKTKPPCKSEGQGKFAILSQFDDILTNLLLDNLYLPFVTHKMQSNFEDSCKFVLIR
jgi:hypothetical protein